jgi:hypothetical protein
VPFWGLPDDDWPPVEGTFMHGFGPALDDDDDGKGSRKLDRRS